MMQEYRGVFRTAYNHPDIILHLSDHARSLADWLLAFFEDEIRSGVVFRPDEVMQVGFVAVILKEGSAGDLEVWEAGFHKMPIEWVFGADNTSRFILVQKETCARVGAGAEFPSILQAGIIAKDFLAGREGFVMNRDVPNGKDSGWVFQDLRERHAEARYCSLFEVAANRPSVIPYLALPTGFSVSFSSNGVEVKSGSKAVSSDNDAYLRSVHGSGTFGWRSSGIQTPLPLPDGSV